MKKPLKLNTNTDKGVTVPELLVVIAIIAMVFQLSYFSFTRISDYNSADKHASVAQSFVERARQHSLNSRNNLQHGIRFTSSTISVFEGTAYSATGTFARLETPAGVQLQSVNLTGGASSIIFSKITGEPSATGTITFQSSRSASTTKTITIYGTGHSEVQ